MNRRKALKLGALATLSVAANSRSAETATSPATPLAGSTPPMSNEYKVLDLPYPFDAMEPYIDAATMQIHHDLHHRAYAANLTLAVNKHKELGLKPAEDLIRHLDQVPPDIREAVRNSGGGYVNHNLYWKFLKKNAPSEPVGELKEAIAKQFNQFSGFKEKFSASAMGVFGSGWTWLTMDDNKNLQIESTANQDSPLTGGRIPLLGIDVWEHAYYLKYHNRRKEYVDAFFHIINWDYVAERYEKGDI